MIVPTEVVPAVRFKVCPLQIGPLLDTVGVAGPLGFININGPTGAEGQLFKTTNTFE